MSVRGPDAGLGDRPSRRDVLKVAAAVTGGAALSLSGATAAVAAGERGPRSDRALVGAIRWDAWVGRDWSEGSSVNRTLSPEKYHFRLPYFAEITVAERSLVDQGFDTEVTGAAPTGWAVSASAGTGVSVVEGPHREGKSVHLHDASGSAMAAMARTFAAQDRAVTVRWEWKETVAGRWSRALLGGGSTTVVDIATLSDAGGKQLAFRTPSGTWQVLQAIADDTWYSIRVIVDPAPPEGAAPWVDIFVDGMRRVNHAPLLGPTTTLDTLTFQTNPSLTFDLYVDNVR